MERKRRHTDDSKASGKNQTQDGDSEPCAVAIFARQRYDWSPAGEDRTRSACSCPPHSRITITPSRRDLFRERHVSALLALAKVADVRRRR